MFLDAEMKRLQKLGIGARNWNLAPLLKKKFFGKKLFGSSNPQALVDTMLYMNGLYFALRESLWTGKFM